MKRDMDLVREILITIEEREGPRLDDLVEIPGLGKDQQTLAEHLRLLIDDAGLVTGIPGHTHGGMDWIDLKLTWQGHEYLGAVKDQEIWEQTKDKAKQGGVATLQFMFEIAKAVAKKEFSKRTGLDI